MNALRGFILAFHIFGAIFWLGGLLMIASVLARVPDEVGLPKERFLGAARGVFDVGTNSGAAVTIGFGIILLLLEPAEPRQQYLHATLDQVTDPLFFYVPMYGGLSVFG